MGLLRVSKAVYKDTCRILYGENIIVFRGHISLDLHVLSDLSDTALAALTTLIIRLNTWPCPMGHDEQVLGGLCYICSLPKDKADHALEIKSNGGAKIRKAWKELCKRLSSVILPGKLDLTIICDVVNQKSGEAIMESLTILPILTKCTIRLGRERDLALRELAQHTAQNLTDISERNPLNNFPWYRLPRELRCYNLILTHLGPRGDYGRQYEVFRLDNRNLILKACCSKCTVTYADCCCPTVYSAYSESCRCRVLPLQLLTVDKQMHKDALEVLCKNWFHFEQLPGRTVDFLKTIPGEALALIRSLKFSVYESHMRWSKWDFSFNKQWVHLITFIKKSMDVPNLSIVVDTRGMHQFALHSPNLYRNENRPLYDTQRHIACTIAKLLPDIGHVRFYLGWHTYLEPLLEKEVMGKRYKPIEAREHIPGPWADVPDWHDDVEHVHDETGEWPWY